MSNDSGMLFVQNDDDDSVEWFIVTWVFVFYLFLLCDGPVNG